MSSFSISRLSIRRHIGVLMGVLTVLVLGLFIISRLPVDLLPSVTYPRIGVRLDAPGIAPEVAVEEITKPLESALTTTEGVLQVYSQTREGQVSLDLFFQPGSNIDQALNDTTATFNRYRNRLPDELESPRIFKFDPTQLPVYEFALTSSTLSRPALRVFADEELSRELGIVPGVASADVSGGVQEEVRVKLDLDRLQTAGVGLNQVLDAIGDRNQDISGGRLRGGAIESPTRTVGRFRSPEELQSLVVGQMANGSPLYLRDIAHVIDGTEDERVFVTLNGEPAVKMSIQKQPDANTIAVVDGIKQRLEQLQQSGQIPAAMTLIPTLDESRFIRNSISNVVSSGLSGAVLAALAVLLFLGSLRQTLIIVLAIPLATLAALILMGLFGLSLNVFSLGGLALGVGIVVDNSIVMLEAIVERVRQTLPERDSTLQQVMQESEIGSQEIESALLASTATNLVSVVPFLLLGGLVSLLFNELLLTISFAVAASLLIGVTVVPMLTSRLLAIRWSSRIGQFWLFRTFDQRFTGFVQGYRWFLATLLPWRGLVILAAIGILGGSSAVMAGQIPQEVLPRINTGQANLFAQFAPGTTLEMNRQVMQQVDTILQKQPETEYVFSTTGGSLFASTVAENPLRSSSTITLKPGSNVSRYVQRVSRELEQLNLVGTRLRMTPGSVRGITLSNSPLRGAEIDVILQGVDPVLLQQAGRQVLKRLDEQVTLASFRPDADDRQAEIQIRPDWERAATLDVPIADIGRTIATALTGTVPTQLQRQERLVDIRVQVEQALVQRPSQLRQLPIATSDGKLVQLGDLARVETGQTPSEIQRINQRPVFLVAGSLNQGVSLSDALTQVQQVLADLELPPGVTLLPSYSAQTNQDVQQGLKILGALAAFLVFAVMAVQYNSLIDPLVIMLTVPLALAGGILGLYVTQTAIGIMVLVGSVLLVGIVVNNAIVMVELANQVREAQGCDRATAILHAAPQRLRPILMTTLTTVLGLFPLALGLGDGGEFLQPLGVIVFSGLALATVLTLVVIPCFYVLLHELVKQARFVR